MIIQCTYTVFAWYLLQSAAINLHSYKMSYLLFQTKLISLEIRIMEM